MQSSIQGSNMVLLTEPPMASASLWQSLTNHHFQRAILPVRHVPLGAPATDATAGVGIAGDYAVPYCLLELFNHPLNI